MKAFLLLLAFAGAAVAGPIDEAYAERVADAIWHAEGGKKAKVSHGILSVPTRGPAHARTICLNSVRRGWDRWEAAGRPGDFIEHFGKRYAPINAKNDPKGLNRHWLRNVRHFLSVTNTIRSLNAGSRYSVESK